MEVTITLTEEQVAKIDMLLNTSQSFNFDDEVAKCLRYGIDNRVYRQGFNVKQNQKRKNEAAELDSLRAKLAALEAKR